jgi:hypothetical protein
MDDLSGGIRNAIHRRPSEADTVSKIFGSMGGFKPRRLWEAGRKVSEMMSGCIISHTCRSGMECSEFRKPRPANVFSLFLKCQATIICI